jgi:hypothetical protein
MVSIRYELDHHQHFQTTRLGEKHSYFRYGKTSFRVEKVSVKELLQNSYNQAAEKLLRFTSKKRKRVSDNFLSKQRGVFSNAKRSGN